MFNQGNIETLLVGAEKSSRLGQLPTPRRTFETFDSRDFMQGRGSGNATPFAALLATGAGIVGSGSLELGALDYPGVVFNATADQNDEAMILIDLPADYSSQNDELCVEVLVRKRDLTGSAAENGDLRLDGVFEHFGTDDAAVVAETAIQNTLPAKTAATSFASFSTLRYQMRGEACKPGGRVALRLNCHEAVGTNLAVEILRATVNIGCHAGFDAIAERTRPWTTGNGS